MFEIHIVKEEHLVPDVVGDLDLDRDIVFSCLSDSKNLLNFEYSGVVSFASGEEVNLSVVRNKNNPNSPIRSFRSRIPLKFCCPSGVAPIFLKPSGSKSILSTTPTYTSVVDVRIEGGFTQGGKEVHSRSAVIYQNLEVETTFNKDSLIIDFPQMILPPTFKLFDLLLTQTIFSDTLTIGRVFVISNTEFFNKFKESI